MAIQNFTNQTAQGREKRSAAVPEPDGRPQACVFGRRGYRGAAHRARLLESILPIFFTISLVIILTHVFWEKNHMQPIHHVRSCFEGFIVRNSMVQLEFNLNIWLS